MDHHLNPPLAANGAPLTRRALSKLRTRRKLLDSAKQLFNARGYGAATVRDIANAAGLSTGAVFASFADKSELFNEVIADDYETLSAHLAAVGDEASDIETALLSLFLAAFSYHRDHLPLLKTAMGHCWLEEAAARRRMVRGEELVRKRLREVLGAGVARGELSRELDLTLTSEMVWDGFVANYRRAIFDGWDEAPLNARLTAQIRIILAGWRAAA